MSLLSLSLLSPVVNAQEKDSYLAIGSSLDEAQETELKSILNADDVTEDKTFKIDGTILDEFLNNGSDESTGVFSSSKVTMLPEGSGLTVSIVTPENITGVTQRMYENAAISAGAKDALIEIGSVAPVTGEGALAGVYEVLSNAGQELDKDAIKTAENQIKIEQLLAEKTDLNEDEISTLVTKLNLALIELLETNEEAKEDEIKSTVDSFLTENGYDFEQDVIDGLYQHAIDFAKSPVALDPETKENLLASLPSENEVIGQKFEQGTLEVEIKDVYLTQSRNEFEQKDFQNVLSVEYVLTNNGEMETGSGFEISLYVDGMKAEDYYMLDENNTVVSPNRSVNVKRSYGWDGNTENMELELKDPIDYEGKAVIIPLEDLQTK